LGRLAPAIFLDRDGTINREVGYLSSPKKLRLFAGAGEAIRLLSQAGFKVIVVTNQSGVARGLLKRRELKNINRFLEAKLAKEWARIDAFYICPHHPDDNCSCRKPRTGLIKKAARDFGLDLSRSYIIGDKLSDIEMGRRARLKESILVLTGLGKKELCRAKEINFKLGRVSKDILAAARYIYQLNNVS
jgi:histidinol-phosphate phosphatase family protein